MQAKKALRPVMSVCPSVHISSTIGQIQKRRPLVSHSFTRSKYLSLPTSKYHWFKDSCLQLLAFAYQILFSAGSTSKTHDIHHHPGASRHLLSFAQASFFCESSIFKILYNEDLISNNIDESLQLVKSLSGELYYVWRECSSGCQRKG